MWMNASERVTSQTRCRACRVSTRRGTAPRKTGCLCCKSSCCSHRFAFSDGSSTPMVEPRCDSKAVNIPSISIIAATAKRIGATVHGIVYPRFAVLHFPCARATPCNSLMVALTKSSHRRGDKIKRFEPHPYRSRVVGPIRGEEKIVCGENSYNTVL